MKVNRENASCRPFDEEMSLSDFAEAIVCFCLITDDCLFLVFPFIAWQQGLQRTSFHGGQRLLRVWHLKGKAAKFKRRRQKLSIAASLPKSLTLSQEAVTAVKSDKLYRCQLILYQSRFSPDYKECLRVCVTHTTRKLHLLLPGKAWVAVISREMIRVDPACN